MSESSAVVESDILASQESTMSRVIKGAAGEQESSQDKLKKLEHELQLRTEEKENYKNRLQAAEKELADLKRVSGPRVTGIGDAQNSESIEKLREDNSSLRDALNKAADLIKDKTSLILNQERQIIALTNQIASLKEVVAITKDLLNIRNMEVQHLQSDVDSMEGKIKMERERHNTMISKMDEAVKLNSELKNEYENQLRIFQDLKLRYEEKVQLLERDSREQREIAAKALAANSSMNNKEENKPSEVQQESKSENPQGVNQLDNANCSKEVEGHFHSVNGDDNIEGATEEFVDAHEEIVSN